MSQEELETDVMDEETRNEFKALMAIAARYKKEMSVATYCEMDLDDVCIEGKVSDADCTAAKIALSFQRAWKCLSYKWDMSARKDFYENLAKFFFRVEDYNRRMKERAHREAMISKNTRDLILAIYKKVKFDNLSLAKKERDILRREERKKSRLVVEE